MILNYIELIKNPKYRKTRCTAQPFYCPPPPYLFFFPLTLYSHPTKKSEKFKNGDSNITGNTV